MLSLLVALVSSAGPVLLQDIAPGAAVDSERYLEVDTGADPNVLVVENDFWGAELFTLVDGRRSLVIDLCPGPCSGNSSELTRFGARLFFLGSDAGDAVPDQLWVTDGTAAGTIKLAAGVTRLQLLDAQLIFQKGGDLWVTDGSRAGTTALTWGKSRTLASAQLTPLHRFIAVNPAACELFVTGADVRQATALPMPAGVERCDEPLATLAERAFLPLQSGLWRFDATTAPAVMIDAAVVSPIRVGSGLFFFRSAPMALSLFRSTGEPGGTTPLSAVVSDAAERLAVLGPRLLYTARHPSGAGHLYASDGTLAGTLELPMVATATHAILPVGPVAYVVSALGSGVMAGTELIETDGTASGTVVLQGVRPAHTSPQTGHREAKGHAMALAMIGGVINETGAFRIRPGEDPEAIFLKPGNPRGSALSEPVIAGTAAFFNASNRAFRTDGTAEGTAPFADAGRFVGVAGDKVLISDGSSLSAVAIDGGAAEALGAGPFVDPVAVALGGTAVFAAGNGPRKLWRTDGTAAGTTALADLGSGVWLTAVALPNSRGVFVLDDTIWFTDGTAAGTKPVTVPGVEGNVPHAANDAVWVVSGLASVSRVTADAAVRVPVPASVRGPEALAVSGDDLFFLTHGPASAEVWRASGSTATKLATLKSARALALYQSRLMVLGDTGDGPKLLELVGGSLVARCPAPGSTFLRVAGGTLFVDAATPDEGLELHFFQEYAQSPASLLLRVADLSPGPGSSTPSPPIAFGKKLLFSAWTPEAGREPWSWEPDPPPPAPKRGCGCSADAGGLALLALALIGASAGRRGC